MRAAASRIESHRLPLFCPFSIAIISTSRARALGVSDRYAADNITSCGRRAKRPVGFSLRTALLGRLLFRLAMRSEEHTSELQSLMRISYAVICLKIKNTYYYTKAE